MDAFKKSSIKGIISLIFLAFIFAAMGIFARYLSTNLLLFQQVYLRLFAAFILCIIIFNKKINYNNFLHINSNEWFIIIIRSISYSLFGIIFYTQAILLTKISNVAFLGSLPFPAILGFIFLHEKLNIKKFVYILIAFVGAIIISVKDFSNIFNFGVGEIYTLISAIFFSLSYIARKWQSDKLNNYELTVINFFISTLIIFILSVVKGDQIIFSAINLKLILLILGAGLFNVANVFLTNYGFQKTSAILAGNILTLESVFAIILGIIFFHEFPSIIEIVGGIAIIISIIKINKLENI